MEMAALEQDCDTLNEPAEDTSNDSVSSRAQIGVGVDVNAETGATVNAPVLTGNTITTVNITYNHSPERNETQQLSDKHTTKQENLTLNKFLDTHKTYMKKKAEYIFEGNEGNEVQLKPIYTELFLTQGDMKDVNQEHEILKIDDAFKHKPPSKPIKCKDIFVELRKNSQRKTVLTKGIAGIGKTFSVHKFILDWAEGEANVDIDCVFLLPFREINLLTNQELSLHELLLEFYPELENVDKSKLFKECNLAFIFDGLDESHLSLDFKSRPLNVVEKRSSVDVLFTSLVRGKLLSSSLVWVTSRPAAANQIPPRHVGLFTEVQGFTDQQKKEYFRKKIPDQTLASRIISHIERSRSLYIMCHIPVFCWITATVLQNIVIQSNSEMISTTLTEMYIHFLLIQMNMKSEKYDRNEERECTKLLQSNREMILKLAKLAFEQLKRDHVIFYEKDLKECGIDGNVDTELTGMIAEIFKKEHGLHEAKVFCFVHLSVQEFLAAVHVFLSYLNRNMQELQFFLEDSQYTGRHKLCCFKNSHSKVQFHELLEKITDKAMQSQRGHLDLFLRFLHGISLGSSQCLLEDLFTLTEDTTESISKISAHIKQLQKEAISDALSVNLFYCLLELKDHSLYEDIQRYLSSDQRTDLSYSMCTMLVYVLLMSEKVLDEFNPKNFTALPLNYRRLIPAVRGCRKALFNGCVLDETCCDTLSLALKSNSILRELDLSDNNLEDSGVKLVFSRPLDTQCQLNILRLAGCGLTGHCCDSLSSAVLSSTSHLTELDLSKNDLKDSGAKILSAGLLSPNQLKILRLTFCNLTGECCGDLSSALESSDLCLRELDLSNNDLQESGVKLLSNGLKNPNCQLNILRLRLCNLCDQACGSFSSVFRSLNCNLTELDLSSNDLQDSGVKILSDGLKSPNCQLKRMRLSGCMVTERGCGYLSSALSSNPSHLRELDLSYNHPGDSGVKLLSDKLEDPTCSLHTLNVDHGGHFRITEGLNKYACILTLDPNTAYDELSLSEQNRKVTRVEKKQAYPHHSERFDERPQVLCKESLSGRCYWETERSGDAHISVSYKGISRKHMEDSVFGFNEISWSLWCTRNGFNIFHNNQSPHISVPSGTSARIGVYVDISAGTVSFYSVSDTHTLTHIHTITSTFTEPLYAGFGIYDLNCSVSLCTITEESHTPD